MQAADTRQRRLPPGPDGVQDLREMRDDPLAFLARMSAEYGDLTRHETDGETVYLVNRPELARWVLKENHSNYTKDRTPDETMLRPLLGNGLLTSSGEDWARQRRMYAPAFRRPEVETFDAMITEAAEYLRERWAAAAGTAVRVDHDLTALTLGVIVKAMLGADLLGIGEGFGRAVDAVNRFIGHYVPEDKASTVPEDDSDPADTAARREGYVKAQAFLNLVVRTIIMARRTAGEPDRPDLLAKMLAAHLGGLSDTELRDQVLTVVMAGHETTAKSLTWTLYLLDRNPDAAAAVYREIDTVLSGRTPTAADLPRLEHCRRAVEEAMRLYPPVWLIARRAIGPDTLAGYDVPPETVICISPYLLHRDPRYWQEPERYDPGRFAPERVAARPSHVYLPFGGGPRICVGQHLAMVEAVLVLATLLQRVRLDLVPGFPVEPEALVTMRPRHGMTMVPTVR
jgi:enediyne biosynthesis protein E7